MVATSTALALVTGYGLGPGVVLGDDQVAPHQPNPKENCLTTQETRLAPPNRPPAPHRRLVLVLWPSIHTHQPHKF